MPLCHTPSGIPYRQGEKVASIKPMQAQAFYEITEIRQMEVLLTEIKQGKQYWFDVLNFEKGLDKGLFTHITVDGELRGIAELQQANHQSQEVEQSLEPDEEAQEEPEPFPTALDNTLAEQIGSYNIPDELDQMTGAPEDPDDPAQEREARYALVDAYLCSADEVYRGWCREFIDLALKYPDHKDLREDFRDIEGLRFIGDHDVECNAHEQHVAFGWTARS